MDIEGRKVTGALQSETSADRPRKGKKSRGSGGETRREAAGSMAPRTSHPGRRGGGGAGPGRRPGESPS